MKKLPLIVLMTTLAGCGGGNGDTASTSTAAAQASLAAETTTAATAAIDSSQFVATAYQDGLAEIQLSQLALQNASNPDVKAFAQRMIDQHSAVNDEITQLAQRKNIALPTDVTPEQKAQANRLAALSAQEFDLAYMQLNIDAHMADVAAFRQQAAQGTDTDVKRFADLGLPILRVHLGIAEEINNTLNPGAFLASAYQEGLAEIQLAQTALQKATGADVKSFAQRLIDDHTQANNRIATLAQQQGVTLPAAISAEQQAAVDELTRFSGADFDRTYLDINAISHLKDISQFRKQSEQGTNADVKSFSQSTLPILLSHLVMVLPINQTVEPSFLYRAFQDGEAELRLSNLALLKSSNDAVKAFAQRMIDDHIKANDNITQLAQQRNLPLPTEMSPVQSLVFVELMRLPASQFDAVYIAYSEESHRQDVKLFTQQAGQGTDPDLQAFAQNTLPTLNAHLALATQLRQLGEQAALAMQ